MSLFEKMGLVEKKDSLDAYSQYKKVPASAQVPDVNYEVDTRNVTAIADIYEKEGMSDFSKSIFRVDEIKSVVPVELPKEIKKKTVLGMLSVSQLNVAELLVDAEARSAALSAFKMASETSAADSIATDESSIAELETQIDVLKQNISTTKSTQEAQAKLIDEETARIQDIVKFIG